MTLYEITEAMRAHDRVHAPGSESAQWQDYCEDAYRRYHVEPFIDKAYDIEVGHRFREFWLLVAAGQYKQARYLGDVPDEWIQDAG